ncbi:SgcJ/EcaC family oxidoreductase [Sorangium sp. So ce131]|uniref:SgcJ/EcaC family oxidoreductase n=1 Tax=Sorangium sp. So ce131 TaxID=3133282 RepID=UPI003F627EC4
MTRDEEAIRAQIHAYSEAFNAHDAGRLAALFVEDGDFVNVLGQWLQGRAAIEEGHARGFASVLRSSRLTFTSTRIKLLKPDLALCHVRWTRDRTAADDDGSLPPGSGVISSVLVQQGGAWRIVSVHNTEQTQPPGKP